MFALLTMQFAQGQSVTPAPAREDVCNEQSGALFFDGELTTNFDNAEYEGADVGYSRTIFAVRVKPALGHNMWCMQKKL